MGLLDKLSANFIVAAFIPSLAFVFTFIVIFEPIIPDDVKSRIPFSLTPSDDTSSEAILLFMISLTLVVGFTLSSLNTFIYKFAEGYYIPGRIVLWRNRHRLKAMRQRHKINQMEYLLKQLHGKNVSDKSLGQLEAKLLNLKMLNQLGYPPNYRDALPTRFGNIFRAAESYSGERYGLDAILIWPRLIHVIPSSYFSKLEQSNNGLAFLVNCMILTFFLALFCFLGAGYQLLSYQLKLQGIGNLLYFVPIDLTTTIYGQRVGLYLFGTGVFGVTSALFYNAALPAAQQYGALIRSSFDLFRLQLLKQLHLPMPADSDEELLTWTLWNEFVGVGKEKEATWAIEFEHPNGNGKRGKDEQEDNATP